MLLDEFHPEDIKAAIRKRYRTVGRFEKAENLAVCAVADLLRGKRSQRTERAVRRVMEDEVRYGSKQAIKQDDSSQSAPVHRLNSAAA